MKNHKPWIITAKASDSIEILLYEMIGEDFWSGGGTTAKSFAEDLKAAGKVSTIHLRVNSPGGNVFDGLAIYNTLLSHGAKVTAAIDGIAASIASVIVMAASEISMNDNAMMMIHNPSTMIGGDAPRMRKMADTLDKIKSSMITAYRRHSTKSSEEIGALLDAETWMTAQETVDNGFAESVTTPEGEEADIAANFDLSHFRKVPVQIAAVYGGSAVKPGPAQPQPRADDTLCGCDCTACVNDDCANCDDPECEDPNCTDCPMQDEASAKAVKAGEAVIADLRTQLTTARAAAGELTAKLNQSEKTLKDERNDHAKWMNRISGELEESSRLYASAVAELTSRCQEAEALHAKLLPRIQASEKLLAKIKAERAAEIASLSTWTERVSSELQQGAMLHASACEEIKRRSRMAGSAGDFGVHVEAAESLFADLKTSISAQPALVKATADLKRAGEIHGSAIGEIARRSRLSALRP